MDGAIRTPFGDVSKKVYAELCKAGWSPGRDEVDIADQFSELLNSQWVSSAALFVRSLGGLSFHGRLWVWGKPIWDRELSITETRIADVVKAKAVPVASSNYVGDGCQIWIDGFGHYYAVDSEGMIFVGDSMATALEVLVGGQPLPEPPAELADKLKAAYNWSVD